MKSKPHKIFWKTINKKNFQVNNLIVMETNLKVRAVNDN